MRAVVYQSNNDISITTVSKPKISNNEALIRVKSAGICGSDLFVSSGKHPRVKPPLIMGHEISGLIVEIKTNEKIYLKKEDRVVINPLLSCGVCYACKEGLSHVCKDLKLVGIDTDGGFAEYVKVPVNRIFKVPDRVSFDKAALVEPLAVAIHAVRRSGLKVGDTVVILGAGPVGLLIAYIVKLAGALKILISEINDYRLETAKKLGIHVIDAKKTNPLDEIYKYTDKKGADILFEAVGHPDTAKQIVSMVRIRGEIIIVGIFKELACVDLQEASFKEITVKGTRVYTDSDFITAINLLDNNNIKFEDMISHQFSMENAQKAFEIMKNRDNCLKILLHP